MSRFTIPRDIFIGNGAIDELSKLTQYKKAIIVTGGHSMRKGGFLQKAEDACKKAGMETKLFEGVMPDPTIECVLDGAKAMQEFEPDLIVAIGGGSPLDAAKAMWVFYEHPELTFQDIIDPFSIPRLRTKADFVAIPSTSGTASEVTAFSVITDEKTKVKYPLADYEITPDIAILDMDIPLTMPVSLTADTGMDALTHAIEAYVASNHSYISDALAIHAIQIIYESLFASVQGNAEARARIHIAQCMAGMAFSNALLGICHSLAHKTGAQFDIPHGRCNAILLPYVIEFNAVSERERYANIGRSLGLPGQTDRQQVNSLVEAVEKLNRQLGIKQSYKENGVSEADYMKVADFIAKEAVADPCTASNPRETSVEDMRKILDCAFFGKDVEF
ncbi:MAG: iron-containing alcohol dehydrogenase [Clostridia bacterium]|nr:iron-containing alcohol dehydrogenase [Clostridia bacterium]